MTGQTIAHHLIAALFWRGTWRVCGVQGGGSSLDLTGEAEALGMTRNENAAVMISAADADTSGAPGAVLTTRGPGLARGMNGLAQAALDRAPGVFVTDGFSDALKGYVTHQVLDQEGMSRPVVKGYSRLEGNDPASENERRIDLACAPCQGPGHIELTGVTARRIVAADGQRAVCQPAIPSLKLARALLSRARRPVVLVGLEARRAPDATRRFIGSLGCPVLTTYKAKGVVPDAHPARVGLFTGGAAEAPTVGRADLIILVGLDPVELILQPWHYEVPVLDIAEVRHEPHSTTPTAGVYGPLTASLDTLADSNSAGDWTAAEIRDLAAARRAANAFPESGAIDPRIIVESAATHLPGARITVDAGAHMLGATGFWPADRPDDLQISNGLASMAFALPAAISTGLADPSGRAMAFVGDGGLTMCIGELATPVQHDAPVTVVTFNADALMMIDLKQQQRGSESAGVIWPRTDFAAVTRGSGCTAWRASSKAEYEAALVGAAQTPGPSLIDEVLDPRGYAGQLKAMQGQG